MHRQFATCCTVILFGFASPALAHVAGPVIAPDTPVGLQRALPAVAEAAPACHTRVFEAGHVPANPLMVEQVTCLDTSCETREILLCPLTD